MRIWIDLANSPHVALFRPVVDELRRRGWEPVLTAREHAQTVPLAARLWDDVEVVGGPSPAGGAAKARAIAARAASLRSFARRARADVALSHGSYAQILAARAVGLPAVTMMDYEHQPANHLSFRVAARVLVPEAFPARALARFGASERKVRRYPGYKEELYLAGWRPDDDGLRGLGSDDARVLAVMRPPPEGALYHRHGNRRFDEVLDAARGQPEVDVVLLPRNDEQRRRYGQLQRVTVLDGPVDGVALLLAADLTIGGGGTMSRESALLGTPTYTVFLGRLSAVDSALMREGRLRDLRAEGALPEFRKKARSAERPLAERAAVILERIVAALEEVAA